MALVTLKNLSFTYPNGNHRALSDISLTIESGAFVTLMGATGSGKSTFLRLLKPELRQNGELEGEIRYKVGRETSVSRSIDTIPQSAKLTAPFPKGSLFMSDINIQRSKSCPKPKHPCALRAL